MFDQLKNHPFAVDAFFDASLVLTYAYPKEQLLPLIPTCLSLDTFQDTHAFVAVAMVQTRQLRPAGFSAWLGNDFILIGYRIFVQYHSSLGKRHRGLYIIKTQTNKRRMSSLGNLFSHYNYGITDLAFSTSNQQISFTSLQSKVQVVVDASQQPISLPPESPFTDWKAARRFAGPLPYTFSWLPQQQQVLIVEGRRTNWKPAPVEVLQSSIGLLQQPPLQGGVLANAFLLQQVPYHWKKGYTDSWKQ